VELRIKKNPKIGLLGINVGPNKDTKNRLEDYLIGIRTFNKLADYITINISSPNTENLRNFHDETKLDELLTEIENEKKNLKSDIPIVVKIAPDIKDNEIEKISDVLLSKNIEAVIISNTSNATREKLRDIQKHQKGGLSGKPIEDKSNLLINKFYKYLNGKIKIIGVGGIDSGLSAYNKFLSGADLVQLYTGMVYKGPNIVNLIKNDLAELLEKDGVKNFSEIIGNR
jgi:dihydroorotate dehydrogenase